MSHLSTEELHAGLPHIQKSPLTQGQLELIVCRPAENERQVLQEGHLDLENGLLGDNWNRRFSKRTPDGSPHPEKQLNIMNARAIALIAGPRNRWALAGDQLYIDFDISQGHLPPGTQLQIGEAIIEVSSIPHNGCRKFMDRFGKDALKFVNSDRGKLLRLRGFNAKIIRPGTVRPGDKVEKLNATS